MKKIYMFLSLAFMAASCQVSNPDIQSVSPYNLTDYSNTLFCKYIMVPVETTEMLMSFDEYLKKSDEEKELDTIFYGNIDEVYDNIYRLCYTKENYITCTIDTKGKSLEDGVWEFIQLEFANNSRNDSSQLYSYSDRYLLPECTLVTLADKAENVYVMSFEGLFETTMKYLGDDNGRDMWEVTARGETVRENDLYAIFNTGEVTLQIKERPWKNENYPGNSYNGHFNVDFMRGDRKLDECKSIFRHGFTTKYQTSRD